MQQIYFFVAALLLCLCLVFSLAQAQKDEKPPPKPARSEFEVRGLLLFDDITFYKVVPDSKRVTVMLVWNKRYLGDYGTESYRADYYDFVKKAGEQGIDDSILWSQMIVNGAQNAAFTQRELGMKKDFTKPGVYLFLPGNPNPIRKDFGSMNPTDMTKWISLHTLFYYEGVKGIVQDGQTQLAHKFISTKDANERAQIIVESKKLIEEVAKNPTDSYFQSFYLKTMETILDRGDDYVLSELTNLATLLGPDSAISNKAMAELKIRRAVLRQFTNEEVQRSIKITEGEIENERKKAGKIVLDEEVDHTGGRAKAL